MRSTAALLLLAVSFCMAADVARPYLDPHMNFVRDFIADPIEGSFCVSTGSYGSWYSKDPSTYGQVFQSCSYAIISTTNQTGTMSLSFGGIASSAITWIGTEASLRQRYDIQPNVAGAGSVYGNILLSEKKNISIVYSIPSGGGPFEFVNLTLLDTQNLFATKSGWNPSPLEGVGNIFLARVTTNDVSDTSLVDQTVFLAKGYVVRVNPLRIRWDIIGVADGIDIGPNGLPPNPPKSVASPPESPPADDSYVEFIAVAIAAISFSLIALGLSTAAFIIVMVRLCCAQQQGYKSVN